MTDFYKITPPDPENARRALTMAEGDRRRVVVAEKILSASGDAEFFATIIERDPDFYGWVGVTAHLRAASASLRAAFCAIHGDVKP